MTSLDRAASAGDHAGLLDKERIIAPADYNRWLVPPAALAIHLCIGMAYGFSVFWLPLGRAVGVAQGLDKPVPCPGDATTFWGKVAITGHALFATDCDWTQFVRGRHPRPLAHCLVDRWHRRPSDRQLHARLAQSRRRRARPDLPPDFLRPRRPARGGLHLQPPDQATRQ